MLRLHGFANRALWPTMHYRVGLSDFSRADYIGYRRVNHTFAKALAPLTRPEDRVWVHDYLSLREPKPALVCRTRRLEPERAATC